MPSLPFQTLPAELVEYGERAHVHFEDRGYAVKREHEELGFPWPATLVCKRPPTILVVLICDAADLPKIQVWVAFAKSSGRDTRLALFMPQSSTVSLGPATIEALRSLGVGLYAQSAANITEVIVPNDLGLAISLPPRNSLPTPLKKFLGAAYDQFERSHWREGFEEACQALEHQAKKHLKDGINSTRIKIMTAKGPKNPTNAQINRMSLGQLARQYAQIAAQNYADAIIGKTLKTINRDRVGVAHNKRQAKTEKRLRANVGRDMYAIINALKQTI